MSAGSGRQGIVNDFPVSPRLVPYDLAWRALYATEAAPAGVKTRLIATCGRDYRDYTQGKRDIVKRIERAAGVALL